MYSKCLNPDDYNTFSEHLDIENFSSSGNYRYEHFHRKWEYGLAIAYIKRNNVKTILNVGGGNSPLSPYLASLGYEVTEIDPNPPYVKDSRVTYIDTEFPGNLSAHYDAVLCTSVIEHVENYKDFFLSLVKMSKNLLYITVDFHPSGNQLGPQHLKSFNGDDMDLFCKTLIDNEFKLEDVNYTYHGDFVYNYTFASLSAKKEL